MATVTSQKIVVVEDDDELRGLVVDHLRRAGLPCSGLSHGADVVSLVNRSPPALVVLDIGLPDADGRDVCLALRASGFDGPVLFLTARDAVVDRVSGFDAGGDDYLVKPFALAELKVRVRALMRRARAAPGAPPGELSLDPTTHRVSLGGVGCELSATEFRLLSLLASRPGTPVARAALVSAGWPLGARVSDNSLEAVIARVRRKLAELPDAPAVSAVRGVGYRLR